jgi:hypothetical protein
LDPSLEAGLSFPPGLIRILRHKVYRVPHWQVLHTSQSPPDTFCPGFKGSSALSVQLQTKSSELTYASQQLGWSSGKAERLIA